MSFVAAKVSNDYKKYFSTDVQLKKKFDKVAVIIKTRCSGTLTTLRVNFSREVRRPCSVSG